ncbi:MAG TPA: TlyA family RNA methyltransferase [Actinobacteria bacterium]|nr:TlyA family RNA methyltransferase [Actinomycetota bacterium]
MTKERLDRLLVSCGLVDSLKKAFAVVITGEVLVDGQVCLKPAHLVDVSAVIEFRPAGLDYVSRGGLKLEYALDCFQHEVKGLVVLDSGASTGGFSDCLLRRGARKVIAVDVGYGQLAWKLRCDERVELHERVNVRYLKRENISEPADMATLDLSFISLTTVMPSIIGCLKEDGTVLALVKPQFEIWKGQVVKGGVVKNKQLHVDVLTRLGRKFIESGLSLVGITSSPIVGAKGNIEYWQYLSKKPLLGYASEGLESAAQKIVEEAHKRLRQE